MSDKPSRLIASPHDGAPGTCPTMHRRSLAQAGLVGSVLVGTGVGSYPVLRYLRAVSSREPMEPSSRVKDVGLASDLLPGACRFFSLDARPALVFRRRDSTLGACLAVCTHLGCTLQFWPDQDELRCGCHGARFDALSLQVLAGPAQRGLQRLLVEVRGERLVVFVE